MRIFSIIILVFLLSAFAVGISLEDTDNSVIDSSIEEVSLVIENISLSVPENSTITNAKGIFKIIESGVKFVGVLGIETMRTGIYFGKDNPGYFTPEFIMKIMKLIIILTIVSLLIKPAFYFFVFVIMGFIWVIEHFKKKKTGIKNQKAQ